MTELLLDQYRQTLSKYSEDLLEATAARTSKFSRAKRTADPTEQIVKTLANPKVVSKMVSGLGDQERIALSTLLCGPMMYWRWDHALRLLEAAGVDSPYQTLQEMLNIGLLCMRQATGDEPVQRFEVFSPIAPEAMPRVAVAAPLYDVAIELERPRSPLVGRRSSDPWRSVDGWEWPIRLALLWRMAWLTPIKKTQQNQLFKRDRERLVSDPLLASDTLDALVRLPDLGLLAYELAQEQAWLDPQVDEQSPTAPLWQSWPDDLTDVLLVCGRGLVCAERWNELGQQAPVGSFSTDIVTARYLILVWLGQLASEEGATVEHISEALEQAHPPWNAQGELAGVLRNPKDRHRLCRDWVRGFLLGPMYQCRFVEVSTLDGHEELIRLSPLGRRFLGLPAEIPPSQAFPQSLFVQPNHQVVLYRQALTIDLLVQMVLFAEPRSMGAALTFEITPASVYHGLEEGLSNEKIFALLKEQSGRSLPPTVEQSILTWSEKRERLSIYEDVSLFEFETPEDLREALNRGLEAIEVTDRIALVEQSEGAFKNLRITASRDYRLEPEPCVQTTPDGVTLLVDIEKSDLMLESELLRLADPAPISDRDGRRVYRVTRGSIERAFEQGLRTELIEQWFQQRTGADPPSSVRLLLRAVSGLMLQAQPLMVLTAESPLVADGLMQHPLTADLFSQRLGPTALAIDPSALEELRSALDEIGIDMPTVEGRPGPVMHEPASGTSDK